MGKIVFVIKKDIKPKQIGLLKEFFVFFERLITSFEEQIKLKLVMATRKFIS